MLSNRKFVILIGSLGTTITLHKGDDIVQRLLVREISEEQKTTITKLLSKYKNVPISIIFDTSDQNYRKKLYPNIGKTDLQKLIRRDLAADVSTDTFKSHLVLGKAKLSPRDIKWECLFASFTNTEYTTKWIDLLFEMPNQIVGIYTLPIESFRLCTLINKTIFKPTKNTKKPKAKSATDSNQKDASIKPLLDTITVEPKFFCFTIQNEISGTRQIVFSPNGLVFTRVVDYNFDDKNFYIKYEKDILNTFEYLKRLFPIADINEIRFVNILPQKAVEVIEINSGSINFHNYSAIGLAKKLNYGKVVEQGNEFTDALISHTFYKSKKILKFTTPKIRIFDKLFFFVKAATALSYACAISILIILAITSYSLNKLASDKELAEAAKVEVMAELAKPRVEVPVDSTITFGNQVVLMEKAVDVAKINEVFGPNDNALVSSYIKLAALRNFNILVTNFSYKTNGFIAKAPTTPKNYTINFVGDLNNVSGDIDDLFSTFDSLIANLKKNFSDSDVKYKDIPRNIDFTSKHYSAKVDFSITKN